MSAPPPSRFPIAAWRRNLHRFDPVTQAVVVGIYVDGMEREEVAAVVGISKRTVSRRLERFLASSRRFTGREPS